MLTDGGFTDDVTVLAAHRRAAPAPLRLRVPAEPGRLAEVRGRIDAWGQGVGLGTRDRAALVLGVSEVMANAVEHAYADLRTGRSAPSRSTPRSATTRWSRSSSATTAAGGSPTSTPASAGAGSA